MKVLLLPGSRRKGSINIQLLFAAQKKFEGMGVSAELITPAELTAPIYDGDLEADEGVPEAIKALNQKMAAADALVVASPEYNGFFSPLLKNTLDWMSRSQDEQPGTAVFRDKPALVLAASPGPMSAARALPHIRTQLSNLGLNVFRSQLGVGRAGSVLSESGDVLDEKVDNQLTTIISEFTAFAKKLNG